MNQKFPPPKSPEPDDFIGEFYQTLPKIFLMPGLPNARWNSSRSRVPKLRTWFRRIMHKGHWSGLCKYLVIISGIAASFMDWWPGVRGNHCYTIRSYWCGEGGSTINQDKIEAIAMKKPIDTTSVWFYVKSRSLRALGPFIVSLTFLNSGLNKWTAQFPLGSSQHPSASPCSTLLPALPVRAFVLLYPTTQVSSELEYSSAGGKIGNSLWFGATLWICWNCLPNFKMGLVILLYCHHWTAERLWWGQCESLVSVKVLRGTLIYPFLKMFCMIFSFPDQPYNFEDLDNKHKSKIILCSFNLYTKS